MSRFRIGVRDQRPRGHLKLNNYLDMRANLVNGQTQNSPSLESSFWQWQGLAKCLGKILLHDISPKVLTCTDL